MSIARTKNKLGKLFKQSKKALHPQLLPHLLKSRLNTFAPLMGAGVRVELIDLDNGLCVVRLPLTRLNKDLQGAQFSGGIFMMTEPFLAILLRHKLGKGFSVIDKATQVEFLAASTQTLSARIKLENEQIRHIVQTAQNTPTQTASFEVIITDAHQKHIAKISKTFTIVAKSHPNP